LRAIRQRLQIHPGADLVICVANLLPIKGLDVLIRAWRQVHMADPLARLLLVGEGPLRG
jgi:glycosyltransferase involved in cell wall biosynthesis